jgi:hypothetical protein
MEEFLAILHGSSDRLSDKALDGGSTVISALIDEFPQAMLSIPSVKEIPIEKVELLTENQAGLYRSLGFPEQSFHTLVKGEIKKLEPCIVECVKKAQTIIIKILSDVEVPELLRFTALRDTIVSIAQESMSKVAAEATVFAKQLLAIQMSLINTDHPDFRGKQQVDLQSGTQIESLTQLVDMTHRYYVIVRKEIIDSIPKAIYRLFFVKGVENMRFDLVQKLVLSPDLHEDPTVAEKRRNCIHLIDALKQASTVLGDVRKTHI